MFDAKVEAGVLDAEEAQHKRAGHSEAPLEARPD